MRLSTEFKRLRGLGWQAKNAIESARVSVEFDRLEGLGMVRLDVLPEDYWTIEDMEGDMYNVEYHQNSVAGGERTIEAQQKRYREEIDREGVWSVRGEFRIPVGLTQKTITSENDLVFVGLEGGACIDYHDRRWDGADSCGGFVGDGWKDSGYDDDIKRATIEALRDELQSRCDTCRQPNNAHLHTD